MRCAACNKDHDRQDSLCGVCATIAHHATEIVEKEEPAMNDNLYFGVMVKRHNLSSSWREGGLGLMRPEARFRHMWDSAAERYKEHRAQGMTQYKAFMKATRLKVIYA